MKKVIICGNYGATNVGDEAILSGILAILRKSPDAPEICVMSYRPKETKALHKVRSVYHLPFGIRSLLRGIFRGGIWQTLHEIRSSDKFILGGGGLFTDEKLFAVFLWGFQALAALAFQKPLYIYGQSIGPISTRIGKNITAYIMKRANHIMVRDEESKKLLKKWGIKKEISVEMDPAFAYFKTTKIMQENTTKKNKYIVVVLRSWKMETEHFTKTLAAFLDQVSTQYNFQIILCPFQKIKDDDRIILNKIFTQMKNKKNVQIFEYNLENDGFEPLLLLFLNAQAVIGMRLHACIFAQALGVPFLPIIYSQKVERFVRSFQMEKYAVTLDSLEKLSEKFQLLRTL